MFKLVTVLALSYSLMGCGPRLPYRINVPPDFRQDPPGWLPPNGEPERVRYSSNYEPFWWNCVIVKFEDLDARCPFTCNGTPGAVAGCADGAIDAENAILQLKAGFGIERTKRLLQRRVREGSAYSKIKSRFPNGPQREIVR